MCLSLLKSLFSLEVPCFHFTLVEVAHWTTIVFKTDVTRSYIQVLN